MSSWLVADGVQCPISTCESTDVEYRIVEDNEGHEDEKYLCIECGHTWWIEGSDA